jgi:hypothetical protein
MNPGEGAQTNGEEQHPYFLTAAEFHARAAAVFETAGHPAFGALARRREAEARHRARESGRGRATRPPGGTDAAGDLPTSARPRGSTAP